ncbi:hypothetical protein EUGRSUZ_C00431 [Eucalyptus grandis]|uniref:Uncharacterized protein n=2 Tax=Eucalyptus grandis TaxID=71139 RepID=A0ACC3LAG5_EUCGR|nr:hypothetical protein EUGRSUZ_C00431 [Eucalyptus grandis]
MATIAAELMLHGAFHGCLLIHDVEIQRRPYHRNCGCALHKLKGVHSTTCSLHNNISFPRKELPANCSLSTTAAKFSSQSCICSGPWLNHTQS